MIPEQKNWFLIDCHVFLLVQMLLKQSDDLEQRFLGKKHLRWHAEIQEIQADLMKSGRSQKPEMY